LAELANVVEAETANAASHEEMKQQIQSDIDDAEASIDDVKAELVQLTEEWDEKTAIVERAKKASAKASKAVDQVLKDISSRVRDMLKLVCAIRTYKMLHRTTRLKSLGWSDRQRTGGAGWRRSSCLYWKVI
jgi:hypothetical protein